MKIVKHTKSILKNIDITEEYFRVVSAVKRVIAPSYEIEKYYDYIHLSIDTDLNSTIQKKYRNYYKNPLFYTYEKK